MKPDEHIEDKPKNHFGWGYLYKVYLVILIAVFLLALANQAHAGVFLEINGNMDYYDSQLPLGDIMQNSDTWDAVAGYMNDVHGVPFPTYSEATATDDLLENVLMYFVGQYCNLSGTAAQQVYETCTDIADTAAQVWDFISLDLETGDFIATPHKEGDLSNVIHGVVDPLIYDEPVVSGPVVGNWYEVPHNYNGYFVNSSNPNVYTCIVAQGSYSYILTASYDYNASFTVGMGQYNGTIYHQSGGSCNQTYNGSYVVGYYSSTYYNSSTPSSMGATAYATRNAALADLFGQDWTPPSSDPVLNGDGYIINENPTYLPLSGYSALNYPYRTKIVDNHTNTTDPDDPVEYPQGVNTVEPAPVYKDVPNWLVDPTVDIPEEPDYLENVDVELPEIEPDTGFITDCYNALPSGIISMIAVGLGLGVVMKIIS